MADNFEIVSELHPDWTVAERQRWVNLAFRLLLDNVGTHHVSP